jgi:hypothetical protein
MSVNLKKSRPKQKSQIIPPNQKLHQNLKIQDSKSFGLKFTVFDEYFYIAATDLDFLTF